MADSTLDITQAFDRPTKLLRLVDNGGTGREGATGTDSRNQIEEFEKGS